MNESTRLRLHIRKEALKFSAAHMTVFPDGTKESLHGHNYRTKALIEKHAEKIGATLITAEVANEGIEQAKGYMADAMKTGNLKDMIANLTGWTPYADFDNTGGGSGSVKIAAPLVRAKEPPNSPAGLAAVSMLT